jgi:ABC-2 type transport system permease protein
VAVYERSYKRYSGDITPLWTRFLVLPRYAFKDVFKSKLLVAFFASCFLFPLVAASVIYLRHNVTFLEAFPDFKTALEQILAIDAEFFGRLMKVQAGLAFLLALFVGPGLVSRELANNGLPLYLSRPFSRAEFVLGKFSVLAILLSAPTWISGWGLFLLQGNFAGWHWMVDNASIFFAIFIGSWAWITTVSLLALALSAWVRWRPVATFMMFMILLGGAFVGEITNGLFRTQWARAANLGQVISTVWDGLLGAPNEFGIPVALAWFSLLSWSLLCLFLLHLKIRAYEVVS